LAKGEGAVRMSFSPDAVANPNAALRVIADAKKMAQSTFYCILNIYKMEINVSACVGYRGNIDLQ
jgi:hypothetical protein